MATGDSNIGQMTPYQRGKLRGVWTWQRVTDAGFETATACLEHQEREYEVSLSNLRQSSHPDAAAIQIEFLNGVMSATRETLSALILQEAP